MTHLTIAQLLALREPGSEPGTAAARGHLERCGACAAELERLHQRVARLKALPALTPARDLWPVVDARRRSARRTGTLRKIGVAMMALAASLAGVAVVNTLRDAGAPAVADGELAAVKQSSQALESMLDAYDPEARIVDGRTATMAAALEERIAEVDQQLQRAGGAGSAPAEAQVLDLWRERVGLLDALVDVHVTRASNVGL